MQGAGCEGLEQAELRRLGGRRRAGLEAKPGEQARRVPLDGVLAQGQAARDLGVACALGHEPQDLQLAPGERPGPGARRLALLELPE